MEALKEFKDNQFDLAIIDPPYGIDRDKWDKKPTKKYWNYLE